MTTAPPVILVTDDATAADLAEAITHMNGYAKRQMHHPDNLRWVMAHAQIDALLDDWQAKA